MIKEVNVTPNKKQLEFFNSTAKYTAYGGARGGGKSWAMRMKLVLLALRYPGINILLLRRTLGELRENHIIPLRRMLDDTASYRESSKEFSFPNGSRIKLGYLDSENDVLQYQGQAYEVIGMEEATQFTYFQFTCLTECNRYSGGMAADISFKPRMYFTCNPGGVGSDWVKRLFIDRSYRAGENPDDYVFIKSLVYDNTYLMNHDPGYVKTLEALPEVRRKAMLYGDWNSFEGMFFPEFDEREHIVPPMRDHAEKILFRALDYGLDMTACLWIAVMPDRRCVVYRELCEPDLILSEAASRIVAATPANENIRYTVASPDLWNRRQDSGRNGAQIMAESGLKGLRKADNSRVPGWRVVREYLKTGGDGISPRLTITSDCPNLIRCLPLLTFDKDLTEDAADVPHEITHSPEALRYALMSREPRFALKPTAKISTQYTFAGRDRERMNDEENEMRRFIYL